MLAATTPSGFSLSFMPLPRLFAKLPNAMCLDIVPAVTADEFRQRVNESQFSAPDAQYPVNWPEAERDADAAWRALGGSVSAER